MDEKNSTDSPATLTNSGSKQISFILFIECPKERNSDAAKVADAIGLQGNKGSVQATSTVSSIPTNFKHVSDIVSI